MKQITEALAPGQIARVRQRTYLIEEIVKPKRVADSTLVRLSCVDDDNQGQTLEVLWENELDPQVLTGEALVTLLDHSRALGRSRETIRARKMCLGKTMTGEANTFSLDGKDRHSAGTIISTTDGGETEELTRKTIRLEVKR
ncbi:MAG: hypothetical protein ABGZ53_28725 [Fuerstiella sp.]